MKKKKGVPSGRFAIHPLTGEHIPIWIGNFVIASYGTGAVMAVPGHDERDFDFAQTFDIPIKRVLVMKEDTDPDTPLKAAETEYGWMVNSPLDGFDGLYGESAMKAIADALEAKGIGKQTINWKIRPWLISRQRYWGTPIPIIHCDECGPVVVPETDLPVKLPTDVEFGQGNPLETSESFLRSRLPYLREEPLDERPIQWIRLSTLLGTSCVIPMRLNDEQWPLTQTAVTNHFMNVDFYCGGIEHAQMHLIYARFFTKALRDLGTSF